MIAALALIVWIYLLIGRGWFWRIETSLAPARAAAARVAVVIPARDEAEFIAQAVASLKNQADRIFVVDDHSSDGTADIAASAGATVIPADPLEPGWTGKLWALQSGLRRAAEEQPDFILLTDADIVHAPGHVANLVARAQADRLDMASLMVKLRCQSFPERALVPAFLYFFLQLYPARWATGAAGGCILIRPRALERIGGLERIKGELIDDCALAREVRKGGRIWMGLTDRTVSLRPYDTFAEVGRMISRTAFTQLRHSTLLLAGTILGLTLTYLAPPLLAIFGPHRIWAIVAWAIMAFTFLPSLRLYRQSPLWAPALPLIAVFYMGATVRSAIDHWRGHGGLWKGRVVAHRAAGKPSAVSSGSG